MAAVDVLKALGFKEQKTDEYQQMSDELGLTTEDGAHVVQAVLTDGWTTALIEKNISPDRVGGVETITKHPPVLILESPSGRVCIPNHDDDGNAPLIKSVVEDLASRN